MTDFTATMSARHPRLRGEDAPPDPRRGRGRGDDDAHLARALPVLPGLPVRLVLRGVLGRHRWSARCTPSRWLARDLVIWRGEDGAAHVMDAYCPHMGAHLGYGGRVEGCNLVCPYHWWEYDGDGANVRIPYADRPNGKARVRSYPTIDRNGLIMFWYHPNGDPPAWDVPEIPELSDPAGPTSSGPSGTSAARGRRWPRTGPTTSTSRRCTAPRRCPRSRASSTRARSAGCDRR